jgi:predicted PhzF superfamily epimerase YddE/YHI9
LDSGTAARFQTLSGMLTAEKNAEQITLDFPAKPATPSKPPDGLLEALGTRAIHVGRSEFDYLVEVESAKTLRNLTPDFANLRKLPVRGIIVTARSDDTRFDFMSRFFAPAVGVDEDPATGSAHCTLAPYWAEKIGKTNFVACQVSARGGVLRVDLHGDRVHLSGSAKTMAEFEFDSPNG